MNDKQILHYRILEELGRGGMGVVYKAEDTKLKRQIAIKFLPRHIASSDEERERFKIEAQAAARLNHANIATIYNIEEVNDELFIVMEHIEGRELRDIVGAKHSQQDSLLVANKRARNASPLPLDKILNYATQIAEGLQAAHEKDIIHRDIKSANIMVTDKGQVKIMDFGLAKVRGGSQVTQLGTTLGTAAYMSPEQARGEEADHRSDIWSFGVVLYEMLTGTLPFPGDYDQAVIYSILNEAPKPVSELRNDIPEDFESMVNKCLEKEAGNRYQNTEELLADFETLSGLKATPKAWAHGNTALQKRTFLFGGLIIIALLIMAGYVFLGRQATPTERVPIAVVDFINQTNEPQLDGLSGMLITALEQSRRLAVISRARMYDEYKQMNRPELTFLDEATGREISKRANIQALAVATIRNFDDLYAIDFRVIEPQTGDRLFSTKVEGEGKKSIPGLLDKLSDKTRIDLKEQAETVQLTSRGVADVTTPNLEAYHHFFKGQEFLDKLDFEKAKEEFRKAIALDSTFGLAYYRLSYAMSWFQESQAEESLKTAIRYIDRIPEKERFLVRAQQAKNEQGFAAGVKVLKQMEEHYPNEKEMLFNIGDYSFHANDFKTAVEYFDKVLAIDPKHARTRFHYGEAFTSSLLTSPVSKSDLESVLVKAQQARNERPDFSEWHTVLARLYIGLEQYDRAEAEFLKYIESSETQFSQISGKLQLLATYAYEGKYRKLLRELDEEFEATLARGDSSIAASWLVTKGIFTMGQSDKAGLDVIIDQLLTFKERLDVPYLIDNIIIFMAAADRLSEALKLHKVSQNPVFVPGLAVALTGCERGAEIPEQLKDATEIPSSLKIWTFYQLAKCQFDNGDFENSKRNVIASQKIHLLPNNIAFLLSYRAISYPKTYLLLGKISEAQRETQQAIEYYEKFLELWKNADDDLPDLIDGKLRLASLNQTIPR